MGGGGCLRAKISVGFKRQNGSWSRYKTQNTDSHLCWHGGNLGRLIDPVASLPVGAEEGRHSEVDLRGMAAKPSPVGASWPTQVRNLANISCMNRLFPLAGVFPLTVSGPDRQVLQ